MMVMAKVTPGRIYTWTFRIVDEASERRNEALARLERRVGFVRM